MANSFKNFSGNWNGVCEVNGNSKPSTKVISQLDDKVIEINEMKFDLEKPTVVTLDDVDNGQKYREITVYDWQWNETKEFINTSAKWIGWYLDQPGSWSGEGSGIIKMDNKTLVTTRKFGDVDEVCTYSQEARVELFPR
jgi:hypothetical protein